MAYFLHKFCLYRKKAVSLSAKHLNQAQRHFLNIILVTVYYRTISEIFVQYLNIFVFKKFDYYQI